MAGDRPKKSWREIDQGREKGGGARRDPVDRDREKVEKSAAYSKYKSQLDKLFTPGGAALPETLRAKLGPTSPEAVERRELLEALRATPSAETLRAVLSRSIPIPEEPRLLMVLLDVGDDALLPPVLDAWIAHVESGKKPSRMLLLQKLTALENRSPEPAVTERIATLRAVL